MSDTVLKKISRSISGYRWRGATALTVLFFLTLFFLLTGCYDSGPDYGATTSVGDSSYDGIESGTPSVRIFYATDLNDNSSYSVSAKLVYKGTYCIVYKSSSDTYMTDATAMAMGKEFDNKIYGKMTAVFGTPGDVDKNGKIILLVLDILGGGSSVSYVAGYFDPVNEYSKTASAQTRYSNQCEMIYMDSNPGAEYPSTFRETMAHEFQHLICYNQKVFIQGLSAGFDTWIDEGLSSAAEKIYAGAQIQDRIDYFNADPDKDILNGQRFIAWNKGGHSSVLGNYSSVYLFFQWLNIQSANDYSIYKTIMNSEYQDYRAVHAAKKQLSSFTGSSFSDILRDWNIANLINKGSGLYGYKGEIATTVHYINDNTDNPSYVSGSTRGLMAGECVYAKITTSYTLAPTSNVAAAGVNTSTSTVDPIGSSYTGNVLLVYTTTATDLADTNITGSLPSKVASVSSLASVRESSSAVTKMYPIDKVFKYNGTDFNK